MDHHLIVGALLVPDVFDPESGHCAGTTEEIAHRVAVVEMQIEQRAAGEIAVGEPVLPGVAVDRRRQAAEIGAVELAEFTGLEHGGRVIIFGPGADAHADVEELAALFDRGFDFAHLVEVAAERFFGEHMDAGGQRGQNDLLVPGRGHADVDHVDAARGDHGLRRFIGFDTAEVERHAVVVIADVAHHLADVAGALGRVDVGDRDHPAAGQLRINPIMSRAHEAQAGESDPYLFHAITLSV
ncbi:hypothetical protein SDC9_88507 [bioreactor metagenome]|uniref:Uncharacterized protein n=1 Tax=bioreactor metagenome TaxID=1076179 RepID=A0A644ZM99_9ZZZZ